jgi:phage shock protein A
MEEKIMQLEAEADVMRAPYSPSAGVYSKPVDAEKQLKVEEQLAALKSKLNPSAAAPSLDKKED